MTTELPGYDEIDELVRAEQARWNVPGVAVGIYADGVTIARGYGVTSIESNYPVLPDGLFAIGSISKVFTTTLMMQLVEAGMIDLDTPLIHYLPDLSLADEEARHTITLRHLLTHTSGIDGDGFNDVPEFGCDDESISRMIGKLGGLKQWTRPGELYAYCNIGFAIAGALASRLLNLPFETAMRQRVFQPLGIERSFYFPSEAIAYPMAVGHRPRGPEDNTQEIVRVWYPWERWSYPDGAINAPVGDLLRFAQFHMGDGTWNGQRVLSEESLVAMRTARVPVFPTENVGLGWHLPVVQGPLVMGHDGGTAGFLSELMVVPDRRFAIAVLANSTGAGDLIRAVAGRALELFCDVRSPDPPPYIDLPQETLAEFAGTYRNPRSEITFTLRAGTLEMTTRRHDRVTGSNVVSPVSVYRPVDARAFRSERGPRIEFVPGADGTPRLVRLGTRLAERVAADAP